jgi:N-acetylmuramoyl-L-alanine amidase
LSLILPSHPAMAMGERPSGHYQVSVRIGPPRPAPRLPRIEGPDNAALPLVVIDAGHGGHDPGARSRDGGLQEKDITLSIARSIRAALLESGRVRVALTRNRDEFLVLEERYGLARSLHADLFMSIHADAAQSEGATGATIYTLSEVASDRETARLAARENSADVLDGVNLGNRSGDVLTILIDLAQRESMRLSTEFARTLENAARSDIPFRSTAHRFAGFIVLKAPDMPSVLLETGFISTPQDAQRIASAAGQQAIARGVTRAVLTHFAGRAVHEAPAASD